MRRLGLTSLVLLWPLSYPYPDANGTGLKPAFVGESYRGNVPDADALLSRDDEGAASKVQVDPLGLNSSDRPIPVPGAPEGRMDFDLLPQQWEILYWLVLGASNRHIAET